MSANFIVCPASKYFFAIDIRYVECTIDRIDPNHNRDFRYRVNFDNYRHVHSSVQHNAPIWSDEKTVFIYETMYPHLLVSKLCRFSVLSSSGDYFIGDAIIDLLTLATGPSKIALTLRCGDSPVGRIFVHINVNEVCQTTARTSGLTVFDLRGPLATASKENLSVVVKKRASDDAVQTSTPLSWTEDAATFEVPDHLFSMHSETMLSLTGFLFELFHGGSREGVATILFTEHIAENEREPSSAIQGTFSKASYDEADNGEVHVEDPSLAVKGKHATERKFRFSTILRNDSNVEVGTIRGSVVLDRTITFAQMPEGITVDGVVCGTPLPGFVRPPFLQGDSDRDGNESGPVSGTREAGVGVDV